MSQVMVLKSLKILLLGIVEMSSNSVLRVCCGYTAIAAAVSHHRFYGKKEYSWQFYGYLKSGPSVSELFSELAMRAFHSKFVSL